MKLKVINERLLRKIVKVSLAQIAMFLIFTNVTMAKSEKEDKTVLSKVESSANVLKKTFLAADIKGTVSDDKGEKLPGVNVIIKGTSRGTSTNANGEFSLSNVNNNDVLVLTYVGYESQEIQINNKTDFSIVLKTDAKALDEVVVVGYGTQKRSNITGSISTIKAADLSKVQSPSFDNALQGKALVCMFHQMVVSQVVVLLYVLEVWELLTTQIPFISLMVYKETQEIMKMQIH